MAATFQRKPAATPSPQEAVRLDLEGSELSAASVHTVIVVMCESAGCKRGHCAQGGEPPSPPGRAQRRTAREQRALWK